MAEKSIDGIFEKNLKKNQGFQRGETPFGRSFGEGESLREETPFYRKKWGFLSHSSYSSSFRKILSSSVMVRFFSLEGRTVPFGAFFARRRCFTWV